MFRTGCIEEIRRSVRLVHYRQVLIWGGLREGGILTVVLMVLHWHCNRARAARGHTFDTNTGGICFLTEFLITEGAALGQKFDIDIVRALF